MRQSDLQSDASEARFAARIEAETAAGAPRAPRAHSLLHARSAAEWLEAQRGGRRFGGARAQDPRPWRGGGTLREMLDREFATSRRFERLGVLLKDLKGLLRKITDREQQVRGVEPLQRSPLGRGAPGAGELD